MKFTVVTGCTYVLCSKATDENKLKKIGLNKSKKQKPPIRGEGVTVKTHCGRIPELASLTIMRLAVFGSLK